MAVVNVFAPDVCLEAVGVFLLGLVTLLALDASVSMLDPLVSYHFFGMALLVLDGVWAVLLVLDGVVVDFCRVPVGVCVLVAALFSSFSSFFPIACFLDTGVGVVLTVLAGVVDFLVATVLVLAFWLFRCSFKAALTAAPTLVKPSTAGGLQPAGFTWCWGTWLVLLVVSVAPVFVEACPAVDDVDLAV